MEALTERIKRLEKQQDVKKLSDREQAIIDRHTASVPRGVEILQRAARIDAKKEIDTRQQQRAYAEQAPPEVVQPAKEMLTNLGDRQKVLETFRKLTPEQRQEALKLAPGIAQQLGDDRGGVVGRSLGAVSRGISHGVSQPIAELIGTGGTPEEIEYIRQLDAAASQEFSPARPGDPWYQSGPLQAAEMAPWMATVVGGAGVGRAIATGAAKPVAAQMATRAGLGRATLNAAGKAGELAGITAASFPPQYAQEVDQLKEIGMQDGTQLRLLAAGTAAITGLVEGIVPNPFKTGPVPLTEGAVKAARSYLWEAAKRAPGEMSEEYLQGVTSGLGKTVGSWLDENAEDKSVADAFKNGWEQAKEAALPMAFLLGVPAVGGAGLSAARAQRLQQAMAKGFVSSEDAKELGIAGKNRPERMANAQAELEELNRPTVGQLPPSEPDPASPPGALPPGPPQMPPSAPSGSSAVPPALPPTGQPPRLPGPAGTIPPQPPLPTQGNPPLPVPSTPPSGTAPPPAATPPEAAQPGQTLVGTNSQGQQVFEDINGVRSVLDGNVRITEPVEMRPFRTPEGKIGYRPALSGERSPEFEVAPPTGTEQEPNGNLTGTQQEPLPKPAPQTTAETQKPASGSSDAETQGSRSTESATAGWDVVWDSGKLYRQNPSPDIKPSERIKTRQPVDPSEGVVLATKDQFDKPIPPETMKARQEFVDKAKPGAEFEASNYKGQSFKVLDDGTLLNSSGRKMGTVQSMANTLVPGQITFKQTTADPVSELDQAEDELAGLFGEEETPAPPKPTETPRATPTPAAPAVDAETKGTAATPKEATVDREPAKINPGSVAEKARAAATDDPGDGVLFIPGDGVKATIEYEGKPTTVRVYAYDQQSGTFDVKHPKGFSITNVAPDKLSEPESKWSSETRSKLEAVPAIKGAKIEADEKAGTVKVTRPDGLETTIQFNADEELAEAAKKRGRKPESVHGWYIRKPGEKQGRILIHSKANHTNILNHEVMHWLEDNGVVTKDEVEAMGGREAIAEKYGKWVELKQRKKNGVFQRIYDALELVFSSQARFFEEVGARKAEPKMSPIGDKKPPSEMTDEEKDAEVDKLFKPKPEPPKTIDQLRKLTFDDVRDSEQTEGVGKNKGVTYRRKTYEVTNEDDKQHRYKVTINDRDNKLAIEDLGITKEQQAADEIANYDSLKPETKQKIIDIGMDDMLSYYQKYDVGLFIEGRTDGTRGTEKAVSITLGGATRAKVIAEAMGRSGDTTITWEDVYKFLRKPQKNLSQDKKPSVPEEPATGFAGLPQVSRAIFETAMQNSTPDSLLEILHSGNKNMRAEFELRTGIKLPATVKGTKQVVEQWFKDGKKPAETTQPSADQVNVDSGAESKVKPEETKADEVPGWLKQYRKAIKIPAKELLNAEKLKDMQAIATREGMGNLGASYALARKRVQVISELVPSLLDFFAQMKKPIPMSKIKLQGDRFEALDAYDARKYLQDKGIIELAWRRDEGEKEPTFVIPEVAIEAAVRSKFPDASRGVLDRAIELAREHYEAHQKWFNERSSKNDYPPTFHEYGDPRLWRMNGRSIQMAFLDEETLVGNYLRDLKGEPEFDELEKFTQGIPAYVISGMQRSPGRIDEQKMSGRPIGVAVGPQRISDTVVRKIAAHVDRGGVLFIDSGMFGTVSKGAIGEEPDWSNVFDEYNRILDKIKPRNRRNVMLVAPDYLAKTEDGIVVGDPNRTFDLQRKYASQIEALMDQGARVIIPLQRDMSEENPMSLGETAALASDGLDLMSGNFAWGIPYNAAAWPDDQILAFIKDSKGTSGSGMNIHLLGGGKSRATKLWYEISDIDPTVNLTGDAATEVRNAYRVEKEKQSAFDDAALSALDAILQAEKPKAEAADKADYRSKKTKSGQYVLPGMPGMAQEIDRQDFVRKYRNQALDPAWEWSNDPADDGDIQDAIDSMIPTVSALMNEIYAGKFKELEDVWESDVFRMAEDSASSTEMSRLIEDGLEKAVTQAMKDRPRKSTGRKQLPKSEKTLSEAKSDMQAAHDAAAKLMEKIRKPKVMTGVDPTLMAETVQVAYLYAKAGIKTFKGYVEAIIENFGESFAREFAPYMESGWRALNTRGIVEDPAGKVGNYLTEVSDGNTDTGTGEADQASGQPDRRDGQDATSPADANVLEGTQAADDVQADGAGDTGGVRNRPGGKVRRGAGKADSRAVNESERGGTESGRESTDDTGERGAGIDRAPKSTRPNYHLTNPEAIIGGGPKAKFARNRKAIEIVRDLEETGRTPTAEELDTLAGYTGWGAFGQELFQGTWEVPQVKKGWEEENEWLRIYLGEEDWKSANDSIVNAHYTDPQTVTAMWDMLRRMGFNGGRVLEPSMGIGNFFSLMPRDLMDKSNLTGIELDTMTAKIAKLLHPQANIQQKGYQESQTPNDFYDVILSNVPFGNYKIADRRYKQDFSIHNYFFKRAFDQVKPGGVIAFLTSNMTMDGKTQAKLMRAQIAEQGDLVTAIRLPSGAFQAYAGTKVVADLIIIRKRKPGEEPMAGQDWIDVIEMDTPAGQKISANEYWEKNPKNILGTMTYGHGTTSGRPGMIVQQPADLQAALDKVVQSVPEGIIDTERTATQGRERPNTTAMRQNSVLSQDNDLWIVKGEQLVPLIEFAGWFRQGSKQATIDKNRKEIEGLLDVREAMRAVLDQQAASEDAASARAELNRVYDAFVAKHGPIGKSAAAKHLRKAGDPMANTLLSLEKKEGTKYVKRAIFERPTVRQRKRLDNPTINDAFAMERNRSLDLDMERIAKAAKVPVDEVIRQLEADGKIYKTGTGGYDAADVFLGGNMARKLRQLEAAKAEGMEGLDKSIQAVRGRIPEPTPYSQIESKLGATWVQASDYADFIGFLLNEPSDAIKVEMRVQGWKVTIPTDINNKTEAQHTHGHRGIEFSKLMNAAMNNATVKLTMPDPQNPDSRITDPVATAEANAKIGELREKFSNWIWTSPDRITRLSGAFNEEFNSTAKPEFDDVPLDFEGLALQRGDQPFNLRSHQESAVWQGIVNGKGIFAHEVGTGKTLTMAALAMELRRLGLADKVLLGAHNANSLAVRNEIQEAYPNANVLYVDNLDAKNKDATLQSIATENWDVIVVPHSMAERFQLRPETVRALLKPEMDALEAAALEAFEESESSDYAKGQMPADLDTMTDDDLKKLKEPTAKELVKERMKLKAKIDEAVQAMDKGTGIFFEDMGIDTVMIDEAHLFKKLPITTKQNIKGLNKKASEKGTMMMMVADYIRSKNNGRGVYLFTGTPITNTINEIFNMMRFVMAEEMEASGVRSWDGWFNNFAMQETNTELSSGGTWENFDRLSSFVNLPELRQMVGQYMDIVFADDMPEFKPRENREGRSENPVGRPYKQIHNVTVGMIPAQERISEELKQRYTTFKNSSGKEKVRMMREPGSKFNPLIIEGEGVKLAMDPRLTGFGTKVENGQLVTDGALLDPKDPNLKINKMLHNAMAHYHEHPQTSQMIFMQIGHNDWTTRVVGRTPAGKKITERVRVFNMAREIKRRLMEEGVPENEIAMFSTMTKEKRTETAQLMKEGKVRFAIGSTETMGTGVNAQDELIAMHHLDAPWMPGDLEQRNGRGHRQGNKWNTVHEYRYLTEGPQDGRRWQVLLTKSRFIEKFMKADGTERTIDMDDVDMSDDGSGTDMEKTFSAAAGDPRIMMRIRLEDQVAKLERSRNNHARTITETVSRANQKLDGIKRRQAEIEMMRADYQTWMDNRPAEGDKPSLTLTFGTSDEGMKVAKVVTGLQEINDALKEREERYRNTIGAEVQIGEYRGVPLFMNNGMLYVGTGKVGQERERFGSTVSFTDRLKASWSMSSLQGLMANIPERIAKSEKFIEKEQRFIDMAHKAVGEPFPKQKQLDAKRAKLDALLAEMNANPDISPAWLRAGAPIGTAVFYQGKEYEVAGHRKDTEVLYADGDNFAALPAKELTDKDGTPLFPELQDSVAEDQGDDDGGDGTITPSTRQSQRSNVRQSRTSRRRSPDEAPGIAAADIQKTAEEMFDVAIRQGGFSQKAAGIYKWITRSSKAPPSPEVVRTTEEQYASLATLSHEIAHHIDQTVKVVKNMPAAVKTEVKRLDYEPQKARDFEGWAEFFRRYVTEPLVDVNGAMMPNTIIDAPQTTEWFEKVFLVNNPELAKNIKQFREYSQQFANQSVFARIGTMIADRKPHDLRFKERWKQSGKRWLNRLKSNFLDKFHTLNWIQKEAKERGYKGVGIYDLTMAYFMSASSHATIAFEEGVRSLMTGKQIGKTKLWALSRHLESDGEYDEAVRYALARHTLFMDETKPGFNTGVDVDDAQAWIEEAEASGKADRYEHFSRELAQFNDDLIMMLVDAGALSSEEADKMIEYYRDGAGAQNYFPLHRVSDLEKSDFAGTSSGFVNLGTPVRGRSKSGSGRQIVDPVDATIARAIKFYGRAIQARQAHTLAKTLDPKLGGVGGMGGLMDRIPAKRVVNQGTIEEILNTLVESGTIEEDQARAMRIAARIIDPANGGMASAADMDWFANKHQIVDWENNWSDMEDAAKTEPDALAVISLWRPDYTPSAQKRTVMIYDANGNKLMYQLDDDLYQVTTGMQDVQFNWFTNILREGQRYFKTGAVGASTGFGTANLIRDYFEFQGKANNVKGLKTLYKPWQMLGMYVAEKTRQSLVGKYVGKKVGLAQKPNDLLIRLYEELGGKLYSVIGYESESRSVYRRRKLGKSTMSKLGLSLMRPKETADNVLGTLQELIAISDAPPRLADAEAALEEHGFVIRNGKWFDTEAGQAVDHLPESARIAASIAISEATINFKRIGALGPYVEIFLPFSNAIAQATYRQYQQLSNLKSVGQNTPEGHKAKRLLVYLAALASTGAFYWMLRNDDDDYRNQDAWLRDGYWTWGANGKTYVRIPKPRDFAVVSNVVENVLDAYSHEDARETSDIMLRELGGRIPSGGGAIRGVGEAYIANYDYFRGRELEGDWMKDTPKQYRTSSYTSRMSDYLGKHLGKTLNTSPIQFEHILNSSTGGAYGRLNDLYDAAQDGRLGPEHIPFARGLLIDRHQTRPIGEFYEKRAELKELAATQEIENKEVAPEVADKLAYFGWISEVMTALRTDEAKLGKKRTFENEKYIAGLARAALGYDEQESNPNPLTAKDLPEGIRKKIDEYRQLAVAGAADRLSPRSAYKSDEAYADRASQIARAEAKFKSLNMPLDDAKQLLRQYWKEQHGSEFDGNMLKEALQSRLRKLEELFKAK